MSETFPVLTGLVQTEDGHEAATTTEPKPTAREFAPKQLSHVVDLPEPLSYRIKTKLLGPPIHTEQAVHERLGKPTALAVFASDNLSSSAYATEEILRVLMPLVGIAAFSLVVPITVAMLLVLALLVLSYRQTIKAYPSAGGAYIVTKDNFGVTPAQIAGVALLTDYVLTVAVSTAAGAAALASAFPAFAPWTLVLSVVFVSIIAGGNLKGVKESGRIFAVPTYFFIVLMFLMIIIGTIKSVHGGLHTQSIHMAGVVKIGSPSTAFAYGAGLFGVMHAFASGGAAMTGVEAISNGVPAFKVPAWKNARETLVIMGSLLGVMFLGLSVFAAKVHAVPFISGTPTVISQVGKEVFGPSSGGQILYYLLQAGTMLILILAANTSFADFPRLANFHAGDDFMPRQLTKRGHRLVFSNGIIFLAVTAIVLLVVTDAKVDRLIPLYAIGVFLSFTLSQAGMAKHHVTHKEPKWRTGLVINGLGSIVSGIVCVVIAVTKFKEGAWVIIIIVPVLVVLLFRLNRQYREEAIELERDAPTVATTPVLARHDVVILVDQLDLAAAGAIRYARSLLPDDMVALHFDLDPRRTRELVEAWSRLGLGRVPLEVVECPDRRIERATLEFAARRLLNADAELTVIIPRREYSRRWQRMVHDQTADDIAAAMADLDHCHVTFVPFHLGKERHRWLHDDDNIKRTAAIPGTGVDMAGLDLPSGRTPIADLAFRQRVLVAGKVHSLRVQPWSGVQSLECTLVDDTGALAVVFLGRREIPGIRAGVRLSVAGMVGEHRGRLAILNPAYEIIASDADHLEEHHDH
jgi:amino acid transporter